MQISSTLPPVNPANTPVTARQPEQLPQYAGKQELALAPETARAVSVAVETTKQEAPDSATRQKEEQARPAPEEVKEAVKKLNDSVKLFNSELLFTVDDETDIRVVKILDSTSKEVIRQIPSEDSIKLAKALDQLRGLLIRETV